MHLKAERSVIVSGGDLAVMPEGFLDISPDACREPHDDLLRGFSRKDGKGVPVTLAEAVIFLDDELDGGEGDVLNPVEPKNPDVLLTAGGGDPRKIQTQVP